MAGDVNVHIEFSTIEIVSNFLHNKPLEAHINILGAKPKKEINCWSVQPILHKKTLFPLNMCIASCKCMSDGSWSFLSATD